MKVKKNLKNFDPVNLKILSEFAAFIMSRGARELQMELKDEDDKVCIYICGSIGDAWKEDVDNLVNQLNVQRQHEVESYYWQLSGEDEFEDLVAVGMMVDKAEVTYKDGRLEIEVTRLK